jgi:hypothetical protein
LDSAAPVSVWKRPHRNTLFRQRLRLDALQPCRTWHTSTLTSVPHTPSLHAGLQSEALALVDLLVLVRARRFTGFGVSTFSWVAEELR